MPIDTGWLMGAPTYTADIDIDIDIDPTYSTAFNILAAATVEDHLILGLDFKLSKNPSVAVQYMHAFENEGVRKIMGGRFRIWVV